MSFIAQNIRMSQSQQPVSHKHMHVKGYVHLQINVKKMHKTQYIKARNLYIWNERTRHSILFRSYVRGIKWTHIHAYNIVHTYTVDVDCYTYNHHFALRSRVIKQLKSLIHSSDHTALVPYSSGTNYP